VRSKGGINGRRRRDKENDEMPYVAILHTSQGMKKGPVGRKRGGRSNRGAITARSPGKRRKLVLQIKKKKPCVPTRLAKLKKGGKNRQERKVSKGVGRDNYS